LKVEKIYFNYRKGELTGRNLDYGQWQKYKVISKEQKFSRQEEMEVTEKGMTDLISINY
jgi:hypothetical protein